MLEDKKLHTTVKLNPTLLGKKRALEILHDKLGYNDICFEDGVFDHDLQYAKAVELVTMLKAVAAKEDLFFGVKLTNTFAMTNYKGYMPGNEMYMSGRSLFPIAMNVYEKLATDFGYDLNVSFSAGADALNISDILRTGALTVTIASDLLKPGGYAKLNQYMEYLNNDMIAWGANNLEEFASAKTYWLPKTASECLEDIRYKKVMFENGLPKVKSALEKFDCITAPCMEQCAVCQDVPGYVRAIAEGDYDKALDIIVDRNPLPATTGYVCTHLCQNKCNRNNNDQPVAIRALKRFAAENGVSSIIAGNSVGKSVAVIGAGPAGLGAAAELARNGVQVTVYEARHRAGGMMAIAPTFRLPEELVDADVKRIADMGVEFKFNTRVTGGPERLLEQGFDAVFVGCGFPNDAEFDIPNRHAEGVYGALELLELHATGKTPYLGSKTLIIGGGNTAMDAARTSARLTGNPVSIVYRRTRAEMPAIEEEIVALLAEGNEIIELASPDSITVENGKVRGLMVTRNELGAPDADGRRKPVAIPNSQYEIPADSIIIAIGQSFDKALLGASSIATKRNGAVEVENITKASSVAGIFAGGDAVRGPEIVIRACGDGVEAARAICDKLGVAVVRKPAECVTCSDSEISAIKTSRTRKSFQNHELAIPANERNNFNLVEQTYSEEVARAEASRCLQCTTFCDRCVEVCPNRANFAYKLPQAISWNIPVIKVVRGEVKSTEYTEFAINQTRQVAHIDDFCNECGNCSSFCVHQGKPYADKPRVYFDKKVFETDSDNAYYFTAKTAARREGGKTQTLKIAAKSLTYSDDRMIVEMNRDFSVKSVEFAKKITGTVTLAAAAEMLALYTGINNTDAYLLKF